MSARTIIVGLIVLLAIYLCFLLLRYLRLGRPSRKTSPSLQFREPSLPVAARDPLADDDMADARVSLGGRDPLAAVYGRTEPDDHDGEDDDADNSIQAAVERQRPRPPAEPDASSFGFDALLEVRQMRHIIDGLKARLDSQDAYIHQLQEQIDKMRASQRVAPQYGEAVALARDGYDALSIAERCGISVSEAEMVRSLANPDPKDDQ
ncbi:DUF2802 domain-containing protein [Uliginosibacterium sp. H1]|uniref:DUF2802 domain-containing protein n=1 Tax=Uliginosibacterium sp. H1 TaxID=3114757 RepID=UPI002E177550|nr:DUF2802 domain-containing protein [Uliginosibacterium sp. H1]